MSQKIEDGAIKSQKSMLYWKKQLEEDIATRKVNWRQVSSMIGCKKSTLERWNLREVKLGRDWAICEKLCQQAFQNNVPQHETAKSLNIPSSTEHNIIKRIQKSGGIGVEHQYWMPVICDTNTHDSVIEITAQAQENLQKLWTQFAVPSTNAG